jgi:8-oxo-dGTP pyrophosphatase MutT (NUDIX family)
MKVVYTGEEMPESFTKSIFLAGPSLRPGQEKEMTSWREDALDILEHKDFDGIVFCPEARGQEFKEGFDYDDQVGWEEKYLNVADCIVFWVPRDISVDDKGNLKLPAFTTNVEFGAWADSGKIVYGAPPKADKNNYLKHYAEEYKVPVAETLTETLDNAIEMLGDGVERSVGERYVPLFIWKLPSFQAWYKAQTDAGNRLDYARLLYSMRPKYKSFVFVWVLKVSVYVASEDRVKDIEAVIARPDISCVCLYHKATSEFWQDTEVVLVKEFRSPAATEDGFIRELPGGSAPGKGNDLEIAAEEVHEETGFYLEADRLKSHGARQLAGTFSAHKAHLFSADITEEEMDWFKSQRDIVHGNIVDSERTFIEVYKVLELLENELVDWTTLGEILSILVP